MKLSRAEAEEFLFEEARMLDDALFEDWLQLFTSDGIYWLPMLDESDPEREPSLMYDDSRAREQRVYSLRHPAHYAQRPPSRTMHSISNVQVQAATEDGIVPVRSNLQVLELRPGDRQQAGLASLRALAGRCEHRLRFEGRWKILLKKVVLLDRDLPMLNLTFLV